MDPKVSKPLTKSYIGIVTLIILALFIVIGYYIRAYRALMWIGIVLIGLWILIKILKFISDFVP